MHGKEVAIRLSLFTDLAADTSINRIDPLPAIRSREERRRRAQTRQQPAAPTAPPPPAAAPRRPRRTDREHRADAAGVAGQSLIVRGLTIEGNRINLGIVNDAYLRDTEAVSRAARALSATRAAEHRGVPHRHDRERCGGRRHRHPPQRAREARRIRTSSPAELLLSSEVAPPPSSIAESQRPQLPALHVEHSSLHAQSVFDPDNPFFVGLGIGADAVARNRARLVARGIGLDHAVRHVQRHPTGSRTACCLMSAPTSRNI